MGKKQQYEIQLKKFQYINFIVSPQCNASNVYVSADSNLIDPSHTVKDLGVLMTSDCMFGDHICQVTKKCSVMGLDIENF